MATNPNNQKPTRYQDFLKNSLWVFYALSLLFAWAFGGSQCWDSKSAVYTMIGTAVLMVVLLVGTWISYNKTWGK